MHFWWLCWTSHQQEWWIRFVSNALQCQLANKFPSAQSNLIEWISLWVFFTVHLEIYTKLIVLERLLDPLRVFHTPKNPEQKAKLTDRKGPPVALGLKTYIFIFNSILADNFPTDLPAHWECTLYYFYFFALFFHTLLPPKLYTLFKFNAARENSPIFPLCSFSRSWRARMLCSELTRALEYFELIPR